MTARSEVLLELMKAEQGAVLICGIAVLRKNGGLWVNSKHSMEMDSDQLTTRIMDTGAQKWVIL